MDTESVEPVAPATSSSAARPGGLGVGRLLELINTVVGIGGLYATTHSAVVTVLAGIVMAALVVLVVVYRR